MTSTPSSWCVCATPSWAGMSRAVSTPAPTGPAVALAIGPAEACDVDVVRVCVTAWTAYDALTSTAVATATPTSLLFMVASFDGAAPGRCGPIRDGSARVRRADVREGRQVVAVRSDTVAGDCTVGVTS